VYLNPYAIVFIHWKRVRAGPNPIQVSWPDTLKIESALLKSHTSIMARDTPDRRGLKLER
jgi:hypothetical protein